MCTHPEGINGKIGKIQIITDDYLVICTYDNFQISKIALNFYKKISTMRIGIRKMRDFVQF
jgi:hypothetical protein